MKKFNSILILAMVCLSLWGASRMHRRLLKARLQYESLPSVCLENASPLIVFTTVALGGFRGIIADVLWMRAIELQAQGKFFELVQLTDWITKLEPRFTTVWAFHAWNMVYNISILFPDLEDRWRWVQQGIQLLRDEGLKFNPNDPRLYWELGWLYQHKIGYVMDEAHQYYKMKLAEDMMALFDGPCPDYHARMSDSRLHPEKFGIKDSNKQARLRRLREEYKLLPDVMEKIDSKYGPLDWRLPQTHALYWAYRGRELATESRAARKCEQMIVQCMAEEFRAGKLYINPETSLYATAPNLDLFSKVIKAYEEALARYNSRLFHYSYENFLAEAVLVLYTCNRVQQAKDLFNTLIRKYPGPGQDLGFDGFITRYFLINTAETPRKDAIAVIEELLYKSCFWKALGDEERSAGFERLSHLVWNQYMNCQASGDLHDERKDLPPVSVIRRQAYERILTELPQTTVEGRDATGK